MKITTKLIEKMVEMVENLPTEEQLKIYKDIVNSILQEEKEKSEKRKEAGKKWWEQKAKNKTTKTKEIAQVEDETKQETVELLKIIKETTGVIDGTVKEQNEYWKSLVKKIKEMESVKTWKYKRQDIIRTLITAIKDDKYYSGYVTSPKKLSLNLGTLIQRAKGVIKTSSTTYELPGA